MQWVQRPTTGRQPEPRSFHVCTAVGHRMVVTGGRSVKNTHFNDIHIFDLGKLYSATVQVILLTGFLVK